MARRVEGGRGVERLAKAIPEVRLTGAAIGEVRVRASIWRTSAQGDGDDGLFRPEVKGREFFMAHWFTLPSFSSRANSQKARKQASDRNRRDPVDCLQSTPARRDSL